MADSSPRGQEICSLAATTTDCTQRGVPIVGPLGLGEQACQTNNTAGHSAAGLRTPPLRSSTRPEVFYRDSRATSNNGTGFAPANSVITAMDVLTDYCGRSAGKILSARAFRLASVDPTCGPADGACAGGGFFHGRAWGSSGAGGPEWRWEIHAAAHPCDADYSHAGARYAGRVRRGARSSGSAQPVWLSHRRRGGFLWAAERPAEPGIFRRHEQHHRYRCERA